MNIIPHRFVFNYAILFPDGQYYLGPTWSPAKNIKDQKRIEDRNNRGIKKDAYGYTKARAYQVIANNPRVFVDCVIERLP